MTNEELIMERLDRIEAQIAPLADSARGLNELKDDLMIVAHPASQMLIKELQDVESSFQLQDLMKLSKQMLRSVKNITFALEQLENFIDFATTAEPLLRTAIPQAIRYLDELEQRGVFRILGATLDIRAKLAAAYTPEDIDKIGDGIVAFLGLAQKIADPQSVAFMEKFAEIPSKLDLAVSKDCGPWGLFSACSDPEVKKGLGIIMELTKAMGKLKGNGNGAASVEPQEDSEPQEEK
jgi:uncharacterized protein YjgD (DUF1641 family)